MAMMGNEVMCRVRFGKQRSQGKALLETSEIIFRGDLRLKIPFSQIQSATAKGGNLEIRTKEGLATFELGKGTAEKWLDKILHPKSRIEKLGVKPSAKVALIGFDAGDADFVKEIEELTKEITRTAEPKLPSGVQWIFFQAGTTKHLAHLPKIAKAMRGASALWVVYPKGRSQKGIAAGNAVDQISENKVLSAGRAAGLKDVKVVGFSPTHTALKFVIPVSQR
jgi:hypothetical protein